MRIKLGIPMYLREIAHILDGILTVKDVRITHLTTDSRSLISGDLFLAIGKANDYLHEAKSRGAYTLSSKAESDIVVEDDKDILLKLAKEYAGNLPYILYKIGISGSLGKTTTKEFLKIILSERFKVHANDGNFNNEIGMPMSILQTPKDTQVVIMEMGMNHPGEIKKLSECFMPDIGIITNVGTSHIGNLGSREAIACAKLEILSGIEGGQIFVPHDEALLRHIKGKLTVSTKSLDASYTLLSHNDAVSLFSNTSEVFSSGFALRESHHLIALAFATGVGAHLGLTPEELSLGTSKISVDNTRQSMIHKKDYHFLSDCYNASYESVLALLEMAELDTKYSEKSIVIGDILELGSYTEQIHVAVGIALGRSVFKHIFILGKYAHYVKQGIYQTDFPRDRILINNNVEMPCITAKQIKEKCESNEIIYMKASRGVRLERLLDYFD
jgi:UDP-N-acetylmuramoyl-tripeptide--D-alanyl-D-alanine ligase